MLVAVDIDGVIADARHRIKYIPNWDLFYQHILEDEPIPKGIALVKALHLDCHKIAFVTGRPVRTGEATKEWLKAYLPWCYDINLIMRPDGDIRSNEELKLDICKRLKPDLVIEDNPETVEALFQAGFSVLQFLWDLHFSERRVLAIAKESRKDWA